jgi:asparagine synthase (glutamine-hydrolysing)
MCGINGIFAYSSRSVTPDDEELIATRDHMWRRGPDAAGMWRSGDRRLALGHRRLAIIDVSERSNQPMISSDGKFVIVFNGEIYNMVELRRHVEGHGCVLRTSSDTEVLLHLYILEGEAMLPRLRGMFAFAIWDNEKHVLFLARDPFGIKPLYFADNGREFRFASQVKALLAGNRVPRDLDPAGMAGFFLWGSVPEPFTFYRAVGALPSGHMLKVTQGEQPGQPQPYISLAAEMARGAEAPASACDIAKIVRNAAKESVTQHMLADVEVGLFLSAGVDSGALLGLMIDAGATDVTTTTLGFDSFVGTHDDEVPLAAEVARYYGATHRVRRVSQQEFEEDLPEILEAMDQPSIDGVNTWFIAKATREFGLKVALSGIGGDELLAGYSGFREIPRMARALARLGMMPIARDAADTFIKTLGLTRARPKLAGLFEYGGTIEGAYLLRRALFLPEELPSVLDHDLAEEGLARLDPLRRLQTSLSPDPGSDIARIAVLECETYTRNTLLRDADWAGMAHSVEIRTPLLDIDFLRQVSPALPAIRGRAGKRALAAAPVLSLPQTITNRAKSGFAVPTGRWLAKAATQREERLACLKTKGFDSRTWARMVFAAHAESPSEIAPVLARGE